MLPFQEISSVLLIIKAVLPTMVQEQLFNLIRLLSDRHRAIRMPIKVQTEAGSRSRIIAGHRGAISRK